MDYVRRILQTLRITPSNEQLGAQNSVYDDTPYTGGRRSTQVDTEEPSVPIETNDALKDFRMLVGITTHKSFKAAKGYNINQRPVITTKGRPAPNIGIYPSVVSQEFKTKKNYKTFSMLISSCLGIQIVVAAALTALGAASANHQTITVFGAINTVIAGFLAYLKGSGQPMRYKYYAHEWSKIREYIEQRERDFGSAVSGLDVQYEVNVIRQMYETVKSDIEANTPDRFVSNAGIRPVSSIIPPLAPPREHESEYSTGNLHSMTASIAAMRDKLEGKMKDVEALARAAAADSKKVMILSEKEASAVISDRAKEIADEEKHIESYRSTISTAFEGEKGL